MLDGFKRLFTSETAARRDGLDGVAPWAKLKQYTFHGLQDKGFAIDGRLGATPWRLEWGPSHRPYIQGQELRVRAELGLGAELQLMVMNCTLQEAMERAIFDQYVEGVPTPTNNQTLPEMRWLVMFPKLPGAEMPMLRERFVALSSIQGWLKHWLEGPLSQALAGLPPAPEVPIVLMIGRGRLMLRTALPEADVSTLQVWLQLFETAMREARRVANEHSDSISPSSG